jgi:AcrR family transcriptional regulator
MTGKDHPARARRTQQERRAETEKRVLDAALELIASGGSGSMSLGRVGELAGYSRGIVNHQFGSKDELLRRAARYAQTAVPPPDPDLHGLERLLALVDNYIGYIVTLETPGKAFLTMWAEAVAAEPIVRDIYVERDAWFRALIAEIVAEGIADGSIRHDVDAAALAVVLLGQLRGIGLQMMLDADPSRASDVQRSATEILRLGLGR